MAEKVAKLGISRDKDFMLYVKDGAVWRVRRKQPGVVKGKPEKLADGGFEMDNAYIYFVDKDGDVSRADRAVGGQKRKKTKGPGKSKGKGSSRGASGKGAGKSRSPAGRKAKPVKRATATKAAAKRTTKAKPAGRKAPPRKAAKAAPKKKKR